MAEIRSPMKFRFLDLVSRGISTSGEIADELGIRVDHAAKNLRQYWVEGLLTRKKVGRYYIYEISNSGERRLDWFRKASKISCSVYLIKFEFERTPTCQCQEMPRFQHLGELDMRQQTYIL